MCVSNRLLAHTPIPQFRYVWCFRRTNQEGNDVLLGDLWWLENS